MAKANPRRMLVLLSWLNSAGPTPLPELAERFSCTEAEIIADLDKAMMTGLPPFTGDCLVDYQIDPVSQKVSVSTPPEFALPMRLTEHEALTLIAAARAFANGIASDDDVLRSAIDKVEAHLGVEGRIVVHASRPRMLHAVTSARQERRRVRIMYRSPGSDPKPRVIEPVEIVVSDGRWYVIAVDTEAATVKRYRVDRIHGVDDIGPAQHDPGLAVPVEPFVPRPDATLVTVQFPAAERWVTERHPTVDVTENEDGTLTVRMLVADQQWFAKLVLRGHGRVIDPADWKSVPDTYAATIRALYE